MPSAAVLPGLGKFSDMYYDGTTLYAAVGSYPGSDAMDGLYYSSTANTANPQWFRVPDAAIINHSPYAEPANPPIPFLPLPN